MTDKPFGVNLTILPSVNPLPHTDYRQAIIDGGVKTAETAGYKLREHVDHFKEHDIIVLHKCTAVPFQRCRDGPGQQQCFRPEIGTGLDRRTYCRYACVDRRLSRRQCAGIASRSNAGPI